MENSVSIQSSRKTREDVEMLKQGWEQDPCWDLAETEGFEEFRDELAQHEKSFAAYKAAVHAATVARYDVRFDGLGYGICTNVEHDGPVLFFTDANGTFHKVCGVWSITKVKSGPVPKREEFFKHGGAQ